MTALQQILFWIGVISTVVGIVRALWVFFLSNIEWVNNVSITGLPDEYPTEIGSQKDSIFPQVFETDSSCYSQCFLIRPNNVLIKKMKLIKFDYSDHDEKCTRTTVKVFENISPFEPLVIKTELPEILPKYELIWYGDYGAVTKYTFQLNGRDSNYNRQSGFEYKFGFIQKVRKVIGLR